MITLKELRTQVQAEKLRGRTARQHIGYKWHRKLSIYITYVLVRWFPWCSANMISFLMILVTLAGAWLVSDANPGTQLTGLGLFYLAFLLDKVDGELARYYQQRSMRGAYLDEWYHIIAPIGLLVGLFALPVYEHSLAMTLMLLLAVTLTLVRRFERKWFLLVGGKRRTMIEDGTINSQTPTTWMIKLADNPLFKITSIIERFDVWLLFLLFVVGYNYVSLGDMVPFTAILVGYTIVSAVYALRFALRNYYGEFDRTVRAFVRDGF